MGLIIRGFLMFIVISIFSIAEAAWQGPTDIISGTWGAGNDQFGIKYGDTNDTFAGPFYVLSDGSIIIRDIINGRRKVYGPNGTLIKSVKCVKNQVGEWNDECRIAGEYLQTMSDGKIWVDSTKNNQSRYSLYSSTGELIKTFTSKPSELGILENWDQQPDGNYRITIKYPESSFSIMAPGQRPDLFSMDSAGNLYATQRIVYVLNSGTTAEQTIQHYRVVRYNLCSKEVARLELPQDVEEVIGTDRTVGKRSRVTAGYGSPAVAPNGDVYTWKRTPATYSILKWTWVDDPNVQTGPDAPGGLTVTPSINGLYLTWTASPSDPGCVTGYEISRATSAGGVGDIIGTVTAGKTTFNDSTIAANTMYYYKVRAKAGSEYSHYTSEVSGKK